LVLLLQPFKTIGCAQVLGDLLELEPEQRLQLADPPQALDLVLAIASLRSLGESRRADETQLLVVAQGTGCGGEQLGYLAD
jgi:hypothetical protein